MSTPDLAPQGRVPEGPVVDEADHNKKMDRLAAQSGRALLMLSNAGAEKVIDAHYVPERYSRKLETPEDARQEQVDNMTDLAKSARKEAMKESGISPLTDRNGELRPAKFASYQYGFREADRAIIEDTLKDPNLPQERRAEIVAMLAKADLGASVVGKQVGIDKRETGKRMTPRISGTAEDNSLFGELAATVDAATGMHPKIKMSGPAEANIAAMEKPAPAPTDAGPAGPAV